MNRFIVGLLAFLFFQVVTYAAPLTTVHWGVAKDRSGKVIYTERHTVTEDNGVIKSSETDYFDSSRKEKIGVLSSDYVRSVSMPTYEFRDLRTGYREGLRFENGKYVVYYKNQNEQEKQKDLKDEQSVFSCQGWHYYLIENLNVIDKKDIALNLVLPSDLDFYNFKIEHASSAGDQVVANLKLSNWLLSVFAPKLRLVYDKKMKRLVEYQGVSNILDEKGGRQDVTIVYEYGDAKDSQ